MTKVPLWPFVAFITLQKHDYSEELSSNENMFDKISSENNNKPDSYRYKIFQPLIMNTLLFNIHFRDVGVSSPTPHSLLRIMVFY